MKKARSSKLFLTGMSASGRSLTFDRHVPAICLNRGALPSLRLSVEYSELLQKFGSLIVL